MRLWQHRTLQVALVVSMALCLSVAFVPVYDLAAMFRGTPPLEVIRSGPVQTLKEDVGLEVPPSARLGRFEYHGGREMDAFLQFETDRNSALVFVDQAPLIGAKWTDDELQQPNLYPPNAEPDTPFHCGYVESSNSGYGGYNLIVVVEESEDATRKISVFWYTM